MSYDSDTCAKQIYTVIPIYAVIQIYAVIPIYAVIQVYVMIPIYAVIQVYVMIPIFPAIQVCAVIPIFPSIWKMLPLRLHSPQNSKCKKVPAGLPFRHL